jgi:hypothetical protein
MMRLSGALKLRLTALAKLALPTPLTLPLKLYEALVGLSSYTVPSLSGEGRAGAYS